MAEGGEDERATQLREDFIEEGDTCKDTLILGRMLVRMAIWI